MDHPSGSYAPRSPDLTALLNPHNSAQLQQQEQQYPDDANPFYTSATPQRYRESFSLPSSSYQQHLQPPQADPFGLSQPLPPQLQQHAPAFDAPGGDWDQAQLPVPDAAPDTSDVQQEEQPPPTTTGKRGRGRKQSSKTGSAEDTPGPKQHAQQQQQQEDFGPAPGEVEGIDVRTKFPVARIKRIVQADEDVGKVAQVTPVVVSKALELFMISLALKSADEARAAGSKRVTAVHLKKAVQKESQFDFLSDIVGKISDQTSSRDKKAVKSEDEGDDDEDGASGSAAPAPAPTTRRRKAAAGAGGGRKKRAKSEDEF